MKPDWKGAPEWAQYLAMDSDNTWHWHEFQPDQVYREFRQGWVNNGAKFPADRQYHWYQTLEQRPENKP